MAMKLLQRYIDGLTYSTVDGRARLGLKTRNAIQEACADKSREAILQSLDENVEAILDCNTILAKDDKDRGEMVDEEHLIHEVAMLLVAKTIIANWYDQCLPVDEILYLVTWAEQYDIPCIEIRKGKPTVQQVIDACIHEGAIRTVDGQEFCCDLRPGIGPELWTEEALRRSLA